MFLSIMTPSYNRSLYLQRLYDSLKKQNVKDFEWLIVDDGSIDTTEDVVRNFISEDIISITYFKQENLGKHIAINKGVELAQGEIFFIVDSDDYLLPTAVDLIFNRYKCIECNDSIAGLSFRRGYSFNKPIGSLNFNEPILANVFEFRYKRKIVGDMAEIIKTKVMRNFPFPKLSNERFLTEGLVWNRIAIKYSMIWFPDIIYIGEYLEGGLTDSNFNIRKSSPEGTLMYYSELESMPISFFYKIRANINYWRFSRYLSVDFIKKWRAVNGFYSIIGYPLSLVFLLKDSR